ncbi:MAG: exodeoxyribonuclease VII small subunit [Chitinivibrionales bacterium]
MASEKKTTFEDALKEMEKIIGRLERDDLTLSSALENFERGVALMRVCDTHLKSAEGKLKQLLKGENGEFIEKILGSGPDALDEEGPSDD